MDWKAQCDKNVNSFKIDWIQSQSESWLNLIYLFTYFCEICQTVCKIRIEMWRIKSNQENIKEEQSRRTCFPDLKLSILVQGLKNRAMAQKTRRTITYLWQVWYHKAVARGVLINDVEEIRYLSGKIKLYSDLTPYVKVSPTWS